MRTPAGLDKPGRSLWRRISKQFDLESDPDRAELLFQACKTADQIAELDEAAAEDPLTVKGSMGQPMMSPFIAEARVQRGLLARLLGRMNFEDAARWLERSHHQAQASITDRPSVSIVDLFKIRLSQPPNFERTVVCPWIADDETRFQEQFNRPSGLHRGAHHAA